MAMVRRDMVLLVIDESHGARRGLTRSRPAAKERQHLFPAMAEGRIQGYEVIPFTRRTVTFACLVSGRCHAWHGRRAARRLRVRRLLGRATSPAQPHRLAR